MTLGTAHVIRADARSLPLPDNSVDQSRDQWHDECDRRVGAGLVTCDCPGHEPTWVREGDVWRAVPGEEEP